MRFGRTQTAGVLPLAYERRIWSCDTMKTFWADGLSACNGRIVACAEKAILLMTRMSDAAMTTARASFWNIRASTTSIPLRGAAILPAAEA